MRSAKLLACAALVLSTSGCSFLFTKKPPSTDPDKIPVTQSTRCTSSVVAPVVDTLVGAFQVGRTAYAISRDSSDYDGAQITKEMDIGFGVTLASVYLSSAIYGYVITSNCRALRARMQGFPDRRPEADPDAPSSESAPPPPAIDPIDSARGEPRPATATY